MQIKRDFYLNKLIQHKKNGMAKIVTGIRRCGKSYLLFKLFREHLIDTGVKEDHIIYNSHITFLPMKKWCRSKPHCFQ